MFHHIPHIDDVELAVGTVDSEVDKIAVRLAECSVLLDDELSEIELLHRGGIIDVDVLQEITAAVKSRCHALQADAHRIADLGIEQCT